MQRVEWLDLDEMSAMVQKIYRGHFKCDYWDCLSMASCLLLSETNAMHNSLGVNKNNKKEKSYALNIIESLNLLEY